jgi:hypothetical protein
MSCIQGCAFRGHDETPDSKNRGNFLEMIKILASCNEKVATVVLENASKSAKYTSHRIQNEILQVMTSKLRDKIHEDIRDYKFCIIVDEARDEFKREQMVIVLRFVDKYGFRQEHFFDLVHVEDTSAFTSKNKISNVLFHHGLDIQNIRDKNMMVLAICVVNRKDFWHYFLMIVLMNTMFIVLLIDYN